MARLNAATFLTANEKREAAGYDALEDVEPASDGSAAGDGQTRRADPHGRGHFAEKYRSDQPRAPRGDPEGGQWVDEGGGGGGSAGGRNDPRVLSDATPDDFAKPGTRLANAGGGRSRSPQQSTAASREARLQLARIDHQRAVSVLRQLEPNWRGPARLTSNPPGIEAEISLLQSTTRAADARLAEITRDAVPNTNPLWGVNRFRKELNDRGFVLHQRTRAPGYLYRNHSTGEEVRIMDRPGRTFRTESTQKHHNDYYYRYRPGDGKREGSHITIPNKD